VLRDLLQNYMVGRSWHAEHVCSLNLTFGVITLFSSNFQHFNAFRPLFQKLLEINVKFKLQTCLACQNLLTMQFWSKFHYLFWSYYPFWRKVLKCWKFYEKREITPKWVTGFTSKLHGRQILTCWTCLQLNLTSISNSFSAYHAILK
jgi:hypothetical protein